MELTPGVHGLPLRVSMDDREATFNATAVETPRGLLLIDVGLRPTAGRGGITSTGAAG